MKTEQNLGKIKMEYGKKILQGCTLAAPLFTSLQYLCFCHN